MFGGMIVSLGDGQKISRALLNQYFAAGYDCSKVRIEDIYEDTGLNLEAMLSLVWRKKRE